MWQGFRGTEQGLWQGVRIGAGIRGGQRGKVGAGRKGWSRESGAGQGARVEAGREDCRESGAEREEGWVREEGLGQELEEGREPGADMEERLGQGIRGEERGKVAAGRKGRDRQLEEGRKPGADLE